MESQSNSHRLFQWLLELLEKRGSGNRSSDLIATVRDVSLQVKCLGMKEIVKILMHA